MNATPAWEAFIPMAVTAGMTKRLKLGTLVAGNPYRNPALVAKMAAEIDQASRGRLILGIGAGWYEREHEAYGWVFPAMKERQDRLEEACALIRKLFTADQPVDFQGQYYRLERAPLSPGQLPEAARPDHDRRQRRAPHPAHGGALRGHLQLQWLGGDGCRGVQAQTQRAGAALRSHR